MNKKQKQEEEATATEWQLRLESTFEVMNQTQHLGKERGRDRLRGDSGMSSRTSDEEVVRFKNIQDNFSVCNLNLYLVPVVDF